MTDIMGTMKVSVFLGSAMAIMVLTTAVHAKTTPNGSPIKDDVLDDEKTTKPAAPDTASDVESDPAPAAEPASDTASVPDIDAAAKSLIGTWRCQGNMVSLETGKLADSKGVLKTSIDLDHWWITSTYVEAKKVGVKFTTHRTYDASNHVWTRLDITNIGRYAISSAPPAVDGEQRFMSVPGKNEPTLRAIERADGKTISITSDSTRDGGKTWARLYELTCKK